MNDGDSWRAGDRTLRAVTPPLFDSPVTRGLFDEKTGVYWAVDAFATPLPRPMDDIAELDPMAWRGGLELFNRMNSPWFRLLDPDKFERHVDGIQSMDISVLASCHSPVIRGSKIDDAFSMIRAIPHGDPPPQPNQLDLDELMHCIATGKEYAWVPQPPPPTPGAGAGAGAPAQ